MRFIRKGTAVEAMQWDGDNANSIVAWLQGEWKEGGIWLKQKIQGPYELGRALDPATVKWSLVFPAMLPPVESELQIVTMRSLHGGLADDETELLEGWWVVKFYNMTHDRFDLYLMPPVDFEATYESV